MEIIQPSTRPTEAISNADALLRIESQCRKNFELRTWLDRANAEVARLEGFSEEGANRRMQTTDIQVQTHIDNVLAELTSALTRLDTQIEAAESDIKRAEMDDWNRPIDNLAITPVSVVLPALPKTTSLISDIQDTHKIWTWKPGAIVGGSIAGLALLSSLLGGKITPYEFLGGPAACFIYMLVVGKIISKMGFSGWLCLLYLIPLVNVIMIWMAAGRDWPVELERNALRERLTAVEQARRA